MYLTLHFGRDSSVDIATGYGLDGPGSNPGGGRYFPHAIRPALEPTQPLIDWVLGLSLRPGRGVDHPPSFNAEV